MSALASARVHVRSVGERWLRDLPPGRQLRAGAARRELERLARRRPGGRLRVLDAGCEDGVVTCDLAARHPEWELTGVDRDPDAVERARGLAAQCGTGNVAFVGGDVTETLGDRDYDAVLALECLSQVPDDRRALACMATALVPGGLLVLHVPEAAWKPLLASSPRAWKAELRHGYRRAELVDLVREAGLEVERVDETFRATAHAAQELRERLKQRRQAVQAAAYPLMRAAVALERAGLTTGAARGLLVVAARPPDQR